MTNEIKNVFISHRHEDDAGLADVKSLLAKNGVDMRDASINSDKPNNAKNPDYIWNSILKPRIDWAGAMLVYITPDTKESDWVNKEIEYANKSGKAVVGVWEQGSNGCEVPEALTKYGNAIVGWNSGRIIDALNGDFNEFQNPDGTRSEQVPITRHPCS